MATRHATSSSRSTKKDPYLDTISEVWPHIVLAYHDFKDLTPIIEYLLPRKLIYAYPPLDYINDLTERTREQTRRLHLKAAASGKFLVFVRDTKKRVLRSYVFPIEEVR